MPLPSPTLTSAHAVIGLRDTVAVDPSRDDAFIAAVRAEFPNMLNRVALPPETPPNVPHLTLASTSSQLAVSNVQADFEVRFYGDYLQDVGRALDYVDRKLTAVLAGFEAAERAPSLIGVIGTLNFSFAEREGRPVEHILATHLRSDVDPSQVQDAVTRVAVKLRDTYFVNLTLSNYESRVLERPIMRGMTTMRVRPWEGRVDDEGLQLAIDINNNLEGRTHERDPELTVDGLRAVTNILRDVATETGPHYVETGHLSTERLAATSMA